MMEINADVAKTSIGNGKRRNGFEIGQEDKISDLPDSILVHILSLLPTRDAVKTVLIPPFGHLWTSTHSLDFDWCTYHDCSDVDYEDKRCLHLIRHALILHTRPTIYKFRLNFGFSFSHSWDDYALQEIKGDEFYVRGMKLANELDTWIRFAVRKSVKILEIDLQAYGYSEPELNYKLPNFVLNSSHLTGLKLVSCALNPRRHIQMSSLKILSLSEIELSDELFSDILFGSPSLEDLSLIRCYGLQKLYFSSLYMKKLVLFVGWREESKLEIYCPNVRSLCISECLQRVELIDASSLIDATLDFSFCFRFPQNEYDDVRRLFKKLHHAKAFTVCTWCTLDVIVCVACTSLYCVSFSA